ncbi:MAG: ATP-dependent metallopeptidase FtsH/Yme1/Tma family protein [Myxococcales bacterium]|nr:ATP-dependent metallopeptidase FtsH/Yme1/Tma family protein [Myxococcales bacterium]
MPPKRRSEREPEPHPEGPPPPPRRHVPWSSVWWLVAMFLLLWGWQSAVDTFTVQTIPYSAFKKHVVAGEVTEIVIEPELIHGHIKLAEKPKDGPQELEFRTVRVEDKDLVDDLEAHDVTFVGELPRLVSRLLIGWLLPIALMIGLWMLLSRRLGAAAGQAMSFGKSPAKLSPTDETGVTFADVAGCEEAKLELSEVVDFLKNPSRYQALGARIPKGILLVGPPGTGKTLLAKAVAGEARVPFYSLSGSDFVEMFVGVGAARVRDLFEQAAKSAPCIIFIDELDAVGRQRGVHMGVVNDEREQTLNQLLVEMDGFEANSGVILLAATNRPDVLDRALLRAGRFDRQVVLDAPDIDGRKAILEVHARGKPLAGDVDLGVVAQATPGFAGADLANTLNEAALLAARRGDDAIHQVDVEEAIEKVIAGPERKSRRLSDALKRRIAVHEVGHALVAYFSPHADPVHKVSIVPRGQAALGYTLQLPTEDQFILTRSELVDRIKGLLGGRAAEDVVFGEVSSGAENDLEKATAIARQMVARLGMSERVGLPQLGVRDESPFLGGPGIGGLQRDCAEDTAREVDVEVRALMSEGYDAARAILRGHRPTLDRITEQLLKCETLDHEAFTALVVEIEGAAAPA